MNNEYINKQLNHKSIRKFKNQAVPKEIIDTLLQVASRTSTSSFMQSASIINIYDKSIKKAISIIGKQGYIEESGHLFIFIADHYRNTQIIKEKKSINNVVPSMDKLIVSFSDAILMAQNVLNAAEQLGYGGVLLGSILNDTEKLIEILNLPEYTFPVLGLAIGIPDQEPQLKPRLPLQLISFDDKYQIKENYTSILNEYDEIVTTYYDLRDSNNRVDTFTNQVARVYSSNLNKRADIQNVLIKQKLLNK